MRAERSATRMLRPLAGAVAGAALVLSAGGAGSQQPIAPPPTGFAYAVKFICGVSTPVKGQPDPGVEGKTDGPGKLCRALGITRTHNGHDLTARPLTIEDRGGAKPRIATTPRIGVDYAGEWAKKPWRFVDADSPHLSRKLR